MAQNFKLKVLTLITKLSDRDTYTIASTELNSMAHSLDHTTLPTFLSCILSTNSTDKSLVRKNSLHLLSTLALLFSNALSSHLSKILAYVIRRLRDSDSSVRTQCVTTVTSLASKITKLPFSTAFLKPLSEAAFTEQELQAQIGSALCLAAAIDAAPDPEPGRLGRAVVGRMERLLKSEGYKGKSGGLVVMGSAIGVGGVSGYSGMGGLVKCLVGFLSCDDWAARKGAAEALGRLAIVERDAMTEFKNDCLKVFENRKFDKVKAAREVMSEMIEAWKKVPDVSEEASPPPRSMASSKDKGEDASDRRYPPGTKTPCPGSQIRNRNVLASRQTQPDGSSATPARKRGPLKSAERKNLSMLQKVDCKRSSDWGLDVAAPLTRVCDNDHEEKNVSLPERRYAKQETKRALFGKNSDDKMHKCGGVKYGSRVAPCQDEKDVSPVVASNCTENQHINHKDSEELSSIRNQLVQIERQQSSLLDLVQRFMGSSQNGMHSLETRVQGLELALDEISYDLALSSGRMTNTDRRRSTCCLLPGADFFSSKFWRKVESCHSTARIVASSGTPSFVPMRHTAHANSNAETSSLQPQRGVGFIVNPLAEIHSDSRGILEAGRITTSIS